jgi:hypothetical protein
VTWTRLAELTGGGKDDCSIDSKRKIIIIVLRWISSHKAQQSLHTQPKRSPIPEFSNTVFLGITMEIQLLFWDNMESQSIAFAFHKIFAHSFMAKF